MLKIPYTTYRIPKQLRSKSITIIELHHRKVGIVGQGRSSRSNAKNRVLTSLLLCFKVKGQGSRSIFWRAAVNIRGSILPSAVKSNNSQYQSKVFVCVSVISGHMLNLCRCGRSAFNYVFISLQEVQLGSLRVFQYLH